MTVGGPGPATGEGGEGLLRGGSKEAVKQGHDNGSKGRVPKGVHGHVLQQESLSWQITHRTGVEIAVALASVAHPTWVKNRETNA
jgi:hypothetical protein